VLLLIPICTLTPFSVEYLLTFSDAVAVADRLADFQKHCVATYDSLQSFPQLWTVGHWDAICFDYWLVNNRWKSWADKLIHIIRLNKYHLSGSQYDTLRSENPKSARSCTKRSSKVETSHFNNHRSRSLVSLILIDSRCSCNVASGLPAMSSLYQVLLLRPLLEDPRPSRNHLEWTPLNPLSVTLILTASLALLVPQLHPPAVLKVKKSCQWLRRNSRFWSACML